MNGTARTWYWNSGMSDNIDKASSSYDTQPKPKLSAQTPHIQATTGPMLVPIVGVVGLSEPTSVSFAGEGVVGFFGGKDIWFYRVHDLRVGEIMIYDTIGNDQLR
ncbi:hypothetical protein M409DRAFT_55479 [Zasmidium cellare ATCC 36951]|uniref:Uncharacterized protein n=1 Tax=Zasmidium cellare ATCC 36951 TaxID=1080233 RepID=A0A6A6CJH9_ZASCE|nr:uncharacterized protein M409DRAFT_55479 [Zasmidium cellare ATCC 36951]KAF2165576.1 hypothetical protein M409DRAFT_55479 [Zasmidium cellare ATCC 36951]